MEFKKLNKVLVLDFGGQYNQLIARRIRELGTYSEVLPYNATVEKIKELDPKGIIFAGGPAINTGGKDLQPDPEIYRLNIPILAIYSGPEFLNLPENIKNFHRVEFYPDENNTEEGNQILEKFLTETCKCEKDWTMSSFIEEEVARIKEFVGDKKVICGLSGGIDSSVAAVLVHRAVGDNLTCIFVDHGFMRKNEPEEVKEIFSKGIGIKLDFVDAQERFLNKLESVSDPETKRKIIGEEFIRVFEAEAKKCDDAEFLVQGTIYSDVIESGTDTAETIKSHHNVGGLPEDMDFALIEPLRHLFKDEVRKVAKELGLPDSIVYRQPFPGPGLAIRIIGDITKDRLNTLKEADAIITAEIKEAGLYKEIWQSFAILPAIKSVGVKGESRTYAYPIVLRAVTSDDALTAEWARLPYELLEKISTRIVKEVEDVNRVVYDITPKPPGTIEWE